MRKPDLSGIKNLMSTGEDNIALTESQYKLKTGSDMPKTTPYLEKKSALSKVAREYGYTVKVVEKTVYLKKTT